MKILFVIIREAFFYEFNTIPNEKDQPAKNFIDQNYSVMKAGLEPSYEATSNTSQFFCFEDTVLYDSCNV